MNYKTDCYINGKWVTPSTSATVEVINPATEQRILDLPLAGKKEVYDAVASAKAAFKGFSKWPKTERLYLLRQIKERYLKRADEIADAISSEMGAPLSYASSAHVPSGTAHIDTTIKVLEEFSEHQALGTTEIFYEPIGVCALITPWNWPMNQIMCKVAPALAAGCTMVLKPSEEAPLSASILAEIMQEVGVPDGVFNMVHGIGAEIGPHLSEHVDVDLVSFTGSTNAGVAVTKSAASTIKKVCLELGGKSAYIVLDDADFELSVHDAVSQCFGNSGQSCNAPTRLLVPHDKMEDAIKVASVAAKEPVLGDPRSEDTSMGPVVSGIQYQRIQELISAGIDEGATLVSGGLGKPENIASGYFVKPTVFANATSDMRIAQEEIFGPVLTIIGYQNEQEAIEIANDSEYGLSGYVSSASADRAKSVAKQLRTGMVHINDAYCDVFAPFGGYKKSGNGREWGLEGLKEFYEMKAIMGFNET